MDYAVPKAGMIPWLELDRTVTPSPVNPMGVKGVGEAGTIGATPAIVAAVVDAMTGVAPMVPADRKSTRLNSSHQIISYAVFCLKKKNLVPVMRVHHPP